MIRTLNTQVRYIGTDDHVSDLFESQYILPEGMAYNSYLIVDEKVAILDTADARKGEEWLRNLEAALEGRKPDYLVIHHMEPDHSATVAPVLEKYPDVTVVGSAMALKFLGQFMPEKPVKNTLAVKEGDTLTLGSHTLKFIAAPMVHWPEVMVSLDTATGVLFSADAFGKFGALCKTAFWADEDPDWACEGRRYYFNICGKYGPQVQALLKKLGGESISVIAPLHGPIIRKDLNYFLNLYNTWSSYGVETEGVFVAFASIHCGTANLAEMVAEKLKALGCPKVAVSDLARDDRAEAVEDAFRYGRMVLAACSYDAGLFTPAHDFLHSLQVKGYSKRKVALIENGSWAPSAARVMKEMLGAMKDVEIVGEPVTIRSRYKEADEPALDALCKAILS
jgi:flavorubredoxin